MDKSKDKPYERIIRYSDFDMDDEHPSRYPVFSALDGRQVTDPYEWHIHQAMSTLCLELTEHMTQAAKDGKALVVMFTHYLEREGHDCRAVIVAHIAKRDNVPGSVQFGEVSSLGKDVLPDNTTSLDELIETAQQWVQPTPGLPPMGTEAFRRAIRTGHETKGANDGQDDRESPDSSG